MYAKKINKDIVLYSIEALYKDNPDVSFPHPISEKVLSEFGVFTVKETEQPSYDADTHRLEEKLVIKKSSCFRTWVVVPLSQEEIEAKVAAKVAQKDALRLEAYRNEADPLFFKAQRGEATIEEWKLKVEEIKARYA